jgi:hypothetical protein
MVEHNFFQRAVNHRNLFARAVVADPVASPVTAAPDPLIPDPKVIAPPKVSLEGPVVSKIITTAATVTPLRSVHPKPALPTTSSSTSVVIPSVTSVVVPSVTSVVPSVTPTNAISSTLHSTVSTSTSFHEPVTRVAKTSSAQSAAKESATIIAAPSSGLGTGGLVGVIIGAVAFSIILAVIVAFFLRRIRKSKRAADGFDPALFRRSAVLLDDKEIDEKFSRPRPPTMIERHQNATAMQAQNGPASANLPKPSMAYPYSDQLSAPPSAPLSSYGNEQEQIPQIGSLAHFGSLPSLPQGGAYGNTLGAYGVPPPGAYAAQYDQAGYGAPPIPGTYGPGAYAAYGADPRSHQYPNQFTQGYPNQISNFSAAQGQQQSFGSPQGGFIPNAPSPPQPPKPFSEKQALHLASVQSEREASPSSSLSQPIQSSDAPPAYNDNEESDKWAANRDQKVRPGDNIGTSTSTPSSSSPATVASSANVAPPAQSSEVAVTSVGGTLKRAKSNARPASSYSLYDREDAYGGM